MTPELPRCPSCAAAVRPGAPWCTQCYAALGEPATPPAAEPAPPPTAEPTAEPTPDPPVVALVPAPRRGEPPLGRWPCTSCTASNPLDRDACLACGEAFLADLHREEAPLLVLPVVGDLTRLTRAQRVLFGVAASGVAVLATGVLGLLLR